MQSRTRTAAAALLLTASLAGATLATGSAQAVSGHRAVLSAHPAARLAPAVHVRIAVSDHDVTRSRTMFRPGNTIFDVRSTGGRGALEVMRLGPHYTVKMLRSDFSGLFNGDVKAVRRVDRRVEFYGGAQVSKARTQSFATYLDAGRYLIADLDTGGLAWMRVVGHPMRRSLPQATGVVNMVGANRFGNPGTRQSSGWMRTTNRTDEPHFVDLDHVKASTTHQKVRKYLDSGAHGTPPWALKGEAGTLVVGPGHTVLWKYSLPRGKYLEMCWWPSDENGMPHAMMGMWELTHLS